MNINLQYKGWPSLDIYIAAIEVCFRPLPNLYLISPYIVQFKGLADKGLNIVDIILPIGGNNNFFLLIKGKVVKWVKSKSFSCGTYLIKPTICKELPTLHHFFKELSNDNLFTHFHLLSGVIAEKY